ncbi:MAG: glutamate--cysteine ligase [Calothrix sp. MO_192.B10]|nr:glutamate--cysteine ligase [Calothrix sp. MO_192.B10]
MLLSKGFEVEIYTGTSQGDIVGFSDRITTNLDNFCSEPDNRNIEYITAPFYQYEQLLSELIYPRIKLRNYLKSLGNYTLIPGSTLSMGNSKCFYRSDSNNSYHTYIENTYGTNVVTASIHINIGISDPELLMRAYRLIRVEAPLYLALSASSPFLDGYATGYHSTRWKIFPQTPTYVPLFESHAHFVRWTETQLLVGTMQNVRHLWTSVRPNGNCRPYSLNRLELRICDFIVNPISLLAVTALLEARLWQLIDDPSLDPLEMSCLPEITRAEDLITITNANEAAVAYQSLEAELKHWEDGRKILARDWIEEIYQQVLPIAYKKGFSFFMLFIQKILQEGNEAQSWLKLHEQGFDSRSIVMQAIQDMAQQEIELEEKINYNNVLAMNA